MDPRYLIEDFREFLKCLYAAGVDYLLFGGHAVAHHDYVRPTTDMDVWIALDDLKANKRASGRNKDLANLDNLP